MTLELDDEDVGLAFHFDFGAKVLDDPVTGLKSVEYIDYKMRWHHVLDQTQRKAFAEFVLHQALAEEDDLIRTTDWHAVWEGFWKQEWLENSSDSADQRLPISAQEFDQVWSPTNKNDPL